VQKKLTIKASSAHVVAEVIKFVSYWGTPGKKKSVQSNAFRLYWHVRKDEGLTYHQLKDTWYYKHSGRCVHLRKAKETSNGYSQPIYIGVS
jgi:hypothetical protein